MRGEVVARLPFRSDVVDTQVFGFYDTVWLTNLDRNATEVDRHLRSFGGGVRLVIANKVSLEAIYAHPQDRALSIDKAPAARSFPGVADRQVRRARALTKRFREKTR